MCTVSNVGDLGRKIYEPWVQPSWPIVPEEKVLPDIKIIPGVTREEFDQLRRDMEDLREVLKAAQIVDEKLGLADCEMEEKVSFLKAVAKLLDVSLEEVWPE